MGAWASGNFENDCACDFRADIVERLLKEAQAPEEAEDIDLVLAAAAMMVAICRQCGVPGNLSDFDAADLGREVLRIYDEQIDGLSPAPDYRRERREVIDRTFQELQALVSSPPAVV